MFTDLRKKSGSLIIYLMFAAIIVTFVISFGPGDQGCRAQPNWVAMVGSEAITQAEFRFTYNNYYDFYQRMVPDFNAQKAKEMNISKAALDSLVDTMLLAQEADRMGFTVTDEEIRKEIVETPYFQQGGSFDREQYNRFVQVQMSMTVAAYEEKVRRELLAKRLRAFLSDSADISESELKEEYVNKNESVDAKFFILGRAQMKAEATDRLLTALTDADADEFLAKEEKKARRLYDENKDRWAKEDQTTRPFDEAKREIARELILEERIAALVKAEAAKAHSLLSGGSYKEENLKKDLPDWDIAVKEQAGILRTQPYLSDIGIAKELVAQLFAKSGALGYLPAPVTVDDKTVIAKVTKHVPADMATFEAERETIRRSLQADKAREIVENYLKALRQKRPPDFNEHWLAMFQKTGGEQ